MSIFEVAYSLFETETDDRDWYVEGYVSVMSFENMVPYAWVEEYDGTILDIGNRNDILQFIPICKYSHEELDAIEDLISNGDFGFPLCEDYGEPRFTSDHIKNLKRSEPEWDQENQEWIYAEGRGRGRPRKKPPAQHGPKRPVGRPKKYRWSDKVSSTNLEHIYYNLSDELMTVDFMSGPTYEYYGVDKKRYDYLKRARSTGKYFHKTIRFSYPYKRIKG